MATDFRKASARTNRIKGLGFGTAKYRPIGAPGPPKPNADPHPLRGTPLDRSKAPSLPMPSTGTPKALTPKARPWYQKGKESAPSTPGAPAAAAIRNQVAKSAPAASSAPRSSSAPSPAPVAPKASPGAKGAVPKASSTGQGNHERRPNLRRKARQAGIDPGAFDKKTLNQAVAKFASTHKWARQPGQEDAVRQAAAYLLSKEHGFYNGSRKSKKSQSAKLPGPDAPGGR